MSEVEQLVERVAPGGRVDRAAGVIRDAKVLGTTSENGREYPYSVLKGAARLYEGIAVNVDHVDGRERSYSDRIGRLERVRVTPGGLYADLHVNPRHALAEQLFWDAEHSPQSVGLSHDATGRTTRQNGKVIVESIDAVRSVDLVAEPASVGSLYESVEDQKKTAMTQTDAFDWENFIQVITTDPLAGPEPRPSLRESVAEAEAEIGVRGDDNRGDTERGDSAHFDWGRFVEEITT